MRKLTIGAVVLVLLGIVAIIVGGLLIGLFEDILRMFVKQQVPLKSSGFSESLWAKPPYSVRMQYWIFDIQNPRAVMYDGAVPVYKERGPYTYREVQIKDNITFYNNHTVTYINKKTYIFLKNESDGNTEDDLVTIPNVPFFTILNLLRLSNSSTLHNLYANSPGLVSAVMNYLMGEEPFTLQTVKVGQFIYTGYDDPIFSVGAALGKLLNISITGLLPKMALFYKQQFNATDGVYLIDTGTDVFTDTAKILEWNYVNSLSFWGTPEANMINGTDGTLYHAFVKKTDILRIFITNICRSLYATIYEPEPDVTVKRIPAYRFSIPYDVFSLETPDNVGFGFVQTDGYFEASCSDYPHWSHDGTLMSGFLNISYGPQTQCTRVEGYPQLPLVITSPHFLFCPKCVLDFFDMADPNVTFHNWGSFLDIEPTTGVGLQFTRRLQLNLAMWSDPNIPTLKNLRPGIYPMVWLNESAEVDDATAKSLYNQIVVPKKALIGVAWLLIVIGILTIFGVLIGFLIYRYRCCCEPTLEDDKEGALASTLVSGRHDQAALKGYHGVRNDARFTFGRRARNRNRIAMHPNPKPPVASVGAGVPNNYPRSPVAAVTGGFPPHAAANGGLRADVLDPRAPMERESTGVRLRGTSTGSSGAGGGSPIPSLAGTAITFDGGEQRKGNKRVAAGRHHGAGGVEFSRL